MFQRRKREKGAFWKKNKGSVSLFFMIINLIFFVFSAVFVDFVRILAAERQLELAAKAAAQSVLTDYNKDVFDGYGLFVNNTDNGKATGIAKRIVGDNLNSQDGYYNLSQLSNANVSVGFSESTRSLLNEATYKHQILEASKYTGLYTFGKDTLEMLKVFSDNSEDLKMLEKLTKEQSKIEDNMEDRLESVEDLQDALKNVSISKIKKEMSVTQIYKHAANIKFYDSNAYMLTTLRDQAEDIYDRELVKWNNLDPDDYEQEDLDDNFAYVNLLYERYIEYNNQRNEAIDDRNDSTDALVNYSNNLQSKISDYSDVESKMTAINDSYKEIKKKNDEIKKIYSELPEGSSTEASEIKKSLEKAIVPDNIMNDLKKQIDNMQDALDIAKDEAKTVLQFVNKAKNSASISLNQTVSFPDERWHLQPSTDQLYNNPGWYPNAVQNKLVSRVENHVALIKSEFVGYNGFSNISIDDPKHPQGLIESKYNEYFTANESAVTAFNAGVAAAKKITEKDEMTQEMDSQTKKDKDKVDKDTDEKMAGLKEFIEAFNALKNGIGEDNAAYDELAGILNELYGHVESYEADGVTETSDAKDFMGESSSFMNKLFNLAESLRNEVLMNEYYLNEFGSKQPNDLLKIGFKPADISGMADNYLLENKQTEYIMYGHHAAGKNYGNALFEVMMLRVVVNLISAIFDKAVQNAFKVHFLFGLASMALYTISETVEDMIVLTKKDKTDRDQRAASIYKKKGHTLEKIKFTYKDHLRLLMLFKGDDPMMKRSLALVEYQTDGLSQIGTKSTEVAVEVTADFKPWFLPMAMEQITSLNGIGSKIKNGKIPLKKKLYLGY